MSYAALEACGPAAHAAAGKSYAANQKACVQSSATNADIEELERILLPAEQVECPLVHRFPPGVYLREIYMAPGLTVIGHEHLHRHANVILSGRALVNNGGVVIEIKAGDVFMSEAGVRKVLLILDGMRYMTIHPNPENEMRMERLEEMFIRKSDSYVLYQAEIATLRKASEQLALEERHEQP